MRKLLSTLSLCVVLAGCSAESHVTRRQSLLRVDNVPVRYALVVNYPGINDEDEIKMLDDLKASVITRLLASGLASSITDTASCDRKVLLDIEDVDYVSVQNGFS